MPSSIASTGKKPGCAGPAKSPITAIPWENTSYEQRRFASWLGDCAERLGAGLSLAADPRGGALLGGRLFRRPDARDRAGNVEAARAADGGGEQARAGRDDRQRRRGEGAARRLYAAARLESERHQPVAVFEAHARSGRGFRADLAARKRAGRAAGAPVRAGEDGAGADRVRATAPREAGLLLVGQRQRAA